MFVYCQTCESFFKNDICKSCIEAHKIYKSRQGSDIYPPPNYKEREKHEQ